MLTLWHVACLVFPDLFPYDRGIRKSAIQRQKLPLRLEALAFRNEISCLSLLSFNFID